MVTEGCLGLLVSMRGEIVEDHGGAGLDLGDQHIADVGNKGGTVHRPLDDPRRDQIGCPQPCDQRLGSPRPKRRGCCQPCAAQRSPPRSCQIGFDGCFVKEHNTFRHGADRRGTMGEPIGPGPFYPCSLAFIRNEALFLYV